MTKNQNQYQQPNPDDRSDNVEKLQDMVQNTIENIEEAEASMEFASGEDKQRIKEKMQGANRALKRFVMKYRTNLQLDRTDTVLKKPGKPGFFSF